MLTHRLAQEIARETAAITGLGILVTDELGVVLGSSDEGRVDTFHEASLEVVEVREQRVHTPEQASALQGVRPGMTMPLIVHDEVLGTVGITGSPAKIRRFGPVVRRYTEMLLRESDALQSSLLRERAIQQLVNDVINYDPDLVEPELIVSRAEELGYNLHSQRVVIVFDRVPAPSQDPGAAPKGHVPQSELIRSVRDRFHHSQSIVTEASPSRIAVFHHLPNDFWPVSQRLLVEDCERMVAAIWGRHRTEMRAGIGSPAHGLIQLHASYHDAGEAMRLGMRALPSAEVHAIDGLHIYQLVAATQLATRGRVMEATIGPLRASKDWPALRQTIIAWCEQGFSLVHAAETLNIHRNTLVQRLARFQDRTGQDFRNRRDAITVYLACIADQLTDDPTDAGTA